MKKLLVLVALLTGCAGFEFELDCRLTENRLVCNGEFPDGGYRETNSGIDSSIADSGVDASIPDAGVDSGQDSGTDAAPRDSGASDARTDSAVVDAGPVVVVPATGVFRVVGSKLFDPNGVEFRIRGNSRTHIDNPHPVANRFKSNTSRWIAYFINDPDKTVLDVTRKSNGGSTANGSVAIIGDWAQTCADNDAVFEQIVQRWVTNAAKYQAIADKSIVNIANEYSPSSDEKWRDRYTDAVKRIRAAGYHGNIEIDGSGCGQNHRPIVKYGQAVLAADPDHNVHFSLHVYGALYSDKHGQPREWRQVDADLTLAFDALRATGLHIVLGEVGPGPLMAGGGGDAPGVPSPTKVSAPAYVAEAEARGFGWLLWSSDDNTEANGMCKAGTFCMTFDTGKDELGANLTPWGVQAVGLWEQYGAKPASVF